MNTHMYERSSLNSRDEKDMVEQPFRYGMVIARITPERGLTPPVLVIDIASHRMGWCYVNALASLA